MHQPPVTSRRRRKLVAGLAGLGIVGLAATQHSTIATAGTIDPENATFNVQAGQPTTITKKITTSAGTGTFEICILADESGSAKGKQLSKLVVSDLFDDLNTGSSARFALTGFRDYPQPNFGNPGDHVYRSIEPMTSNKVVLDAALNRLTATGGNDAPSSGFDSIVAAVDSAPFNDPTYGAQPSCGFSTADTTKVLLVTSTSPFHSAPSGPYANDHPSTVAALQAAGVKLIGLTSPGAGTQLANLATSAGGTTLPASSNGTKIADAIKALHTTKNVEVKLDLWCNVPGLTTTFDPPSQIVKAGETAEFTEIVEVDATVAPGDYECIDLVTVDGKPLMDDAGRKVLVERKVITVT